MKRITWIVAGENERYHFHWKTNEGRAINTADIFMIENKADDKIGVHGIILSLKYLPFRGKFSPIESYPRSIEWYGNM